jgi:hypothetical protein
MLEKEGWFSEFKKNLQFGDIAQEKLDDIMESFLPVLDEQETKYFQDFVAMLRELKQTGINSADYGDCNLGFKPNGNLAYFDLGYGDCTMSHEDHLEIAETLRVTIKQVLKEVTRDPEHPGDYTNTIDGNYAYAKKRPSEEFSGYTFQTLDNNLTVMSKEGVAYGNISYRVNNGRAEIFGSMLKKTFRGRGLGLLMYKFLLHKYGCIFTSGAHSPQARRVWMLLKKDGYNVYAAPSKDIIPNKEHQPQDVETDEVNKELRLPNGELYKKSYMDNLSIVAKLH